MIIINPNIDPNNVVIRKPVTNTSPIYTIILQHNQNRVAFLREVEDKLINDQFFNFDLSFPEEFPFGEYTYYIFDIAGFQYYTIDIDNIPDTCFTVYNNLIYNFNEVLSNFGLYLANGEGGEDDECTKARLLDYGLVQIFNFEEYISYNNTKTYISYDKTVK